MDTTLRQFYFFVSAIIILLTVVLILRPLLRRNHSEISASFKLLWNGIDRRLLWAYWRTFKDKWWEVFWGPTLIGVIFGIFTLFYTPVLPLFLVYAVVVVFLAGFYLWREDHLKLEQALMITRVVPQRFNSPITGSPAVLYYFEVKSKSESGSIRDVHAQLAEIVPPVEEITWLPVPLRQKHDGAFASQAAKSFDLNPGEPKNIDFLQADIEDRYLYIHHLIQSATNRVRLIQGGYRMRVLITGRDVPASSQWFKVWMDGQGALQCQMEVTNESGSNGSKEV